MTQGKLEHVNIAVTDPQRSADLMRDLFGWHIRWEGAGMLGGHTIHVGNDDDYLAIYTNADIAKADPQFRKSEPLNHIGVVVDDLDAVEAKVIAAGLETMNHADYEPGRRFYFFDWNGIEFEVVSYA
ncbi:VOC family protein [Parasphingopyxis lamellibrachiae]|uniref:Catechol 2,3-dioxygenase-like lactoylglutathione lyase family enzyme n=1 Tax=Parasphingopyxis lamellibrachiae TaxID=680125 RepID=A0A3D9FBU0_9SPHN|nr:VOC family protein [Parasphingopyxis lamellibrachiae]RED15138.1 catechol 2,3-dioxygenase-like lactoylglutathione lyase family enzyme [Parasphingopyxis lamellibrachiae]